MVNMKMKMKDSGFENANTSADGEEMDYDGVRVRHASPLRLPKILWYKGVASEGC